MTHTNTILRHIKFVSWVHILNGAMMAALFSYTVFLAVGGYKAPPYNIWDGIMQSAAAAAMVVFVVPGTVISFVEVFTGFKLLFDQKRWATVILLVISILLICLGALGIMQNRTGSNAFSLLHGFWLLIGGYSFLVLGVKLFPICWKKA